MSTTSAPKKILVISTMLLGDCLLSTCITRSLRKAYPNSVVDVLVSRNGHLVYQDNPDIDNILYLKKKPSIKDLWLFIRNHWRDYDLVINERATDRTALYSWALGKNRIGFISAKVARVSLQNWIYHKSTTEPDGSLHRVMRNLELVKLAGIEPCAEIVPPKVNTPDIVAQLVAPYLVVHTPASGEFKQWPINYWQQLVLSLCKQGYSLVFTGGAGKRDQDIIKEVTSVLSKEQSWVDLSGQFSFAEMGTIVERSMGFVGLDTGPTHLAAGYNVPIVAIFGPIPPMKWAPWPQNQHVDVQPYQLSQPVQVVNNVCIVQADLDCVPCYTKQCKVTQSKKPECLFQISPERVLSVIRQHIPL